MKTYQLIAIKYFKAVCLILAAALLQTCKNDSDNLTLGSLPVADFDAVVDEDGFSVQLINKTNMPSIAYWSEESTNQKLEGDIAYTNFVFADTYNITLLVVAQGGTATVTKQVTTTQDDQEACNPDRVLGFLASCTEKTWKLNPEAGTYQVGDQGPDVGNWWASGADEVISRACEFNDEYTFKFDRQGTFIYDNKGDFYADGYLGNGTDGCEPNSNLSPAQQPWASGEFRYAITEGTGVRELGQLQVIGTGAHIGLQKVRNGAENTAEPATSITYDILEMTQNVDGQGYDILKLGVNIGGDAWWTFTLRSY